MHHQMPGLNALDEVKIQVGYCRRAEQEIICSHYEGMNQPRACYSNQFHVEIDTEYCQSALPK